MKKRNYNRAFFVFLTGLIMIIAIFAGWRRSTRVVIEVSSNKSGFGIYADEEMIGITRTDEPVRIIVPADRAQHTLVIADPREDYYPLRFDDIKLAGGTVIPVEAIFPDRPPTIYMEYRGYIPGMKLEWNERETGITGPDGMFRGQVKKPQDGLGIFEAADPQDEHATYRITLDTTGKEEIYLSYGHKVVIAVDSAYDGLRLYIDDVFNRTVSSGVTVLDHFRPDRQEHVFSFRDPAGYWRPHTVTGVRYLGGHRQDIVVRDLQVDAENTVLVRFESPIPGMDVYHRNEKLGSVGPESPLSRRMARQDLSAEFRIVDPQNNHRPWTERVSDRPGERLIRYGHTATLNIQAGMEGLDILLDGRQVLTSVEGDNQVSGLTPDRKTHILQVNDPRGRLKPFRSDNILLNGGKTTTVRIPHEWLPGMEPPLQVTLSITNAVPGMMVSVDGQEAGRIGDNGKLIHDLKIKRGKEIEVEISDPSNRHASRIERFKVEGEQKFSLAYDKTVSLEITDAPAGFIVKLDGRELGVTSEGITLFEGLDASAAVHSLELIDPAGELETQRFDISLEGGSVQRIKPRPFEEPTRYVRLNISAPLSGLEVRWCGESLGSTGEDGRFSQEVPVPGDSRVEIAIVDPAGRHEPMRREFVLGQEKVVDIAYDRKFTLTVEPSSVDNLGIYVQKPDGSMELAGRTSRSERQIITLTPSNKDVTLIVKDDEDRSAALVRPIDIRAGGAEVIRYDKMASVRVTTNRPALVTLRRSGMDDMVLRTQPGRAYQVYQVTADSISPGMYEITSESGREILREDRYLGAGYMATTSFMFVDRYIRTIPEGAELFIKEGTFEEFEPAGTAPLVKSDIETTTPLVFIKAAYPGYRDEVVQADLNQESLLILQKESVAKALSSGDRARERMMGLTDDKAWNEAFNAAAGYYNKAVEADPDYAISRIKLAQLHFERMRKINRGPVFEASMAETEKLLAERPEEFDPFKPSYTLLYFYYRGNIAYYRAMLLDMEKRRNLMEAIDYYRQARSLWDVYAARADGNVDRFAREEIVHNLATALEHTGQNREAARTWRSMIFENSSFQKNRQEALERL